MVCADATTTAACARSMGCQPSATQPYTCSSGQQPPRSTVRQPVFCQQTPCLSKGPTTRLQQLVRELRVADALLALHALAHALLGQHRAHARVLACKRGDRRMGCSWMVGSYKGSWRSVLSLAGMVPTRVYLPARRGRAQTQVQPLRRRTQVHQPHQRNQVVRRRQEQGREMETTPFCRWLALHNTWLPMGAATLYTAR